ncbi:DUF3794 domain-containing protein [Pelosinus propionicus]|uniref:SipL SPOCS domain-containing protein n=1 Tax=Pelosinus propionicus DSM 13327 TaxID=1123291 RepID=A0A1I4PVU4_9FIRM|nr:DUF3794 domain-containing protein [Pelosinus propionicus]SFM31445.1 protein of unknown function [Pelosinus propionicus DSM 13327]
MNPGNIEILGITPQSEFPICPPHYPCSQICQIDKLFLACQHDIQKILKVIVTVTISSFKIINTPIGKKVIVHGFKHIKVISVVDKFCTHSACFDIPFCLFIKLKDFDATITRICTIVEDVSVQCLKNQFLLVSSVIFACPVFKSDISNCQHEYNKPCNCHKPSQDCSNIPIYSKQCGCNQIDANYANQKPTLYEKQNHHPSCPLSQNHPTEAYHTYQNYHDD